MELFQKAKLSSWIIGILVIINLVTLASLWLIRFRETGPVVPKPEQQEERVMRMLRHELQLNQDQFRRFQTTRFRHMERLRGIEEEIIGLRRDILNEVFIEVPDSSIIDSLAGRIGTLETEREKLTADHFNRLQKICDPQQRQHLRSILDRVLPRQERVPQPGRGRRQRGAGRRNRIGGE